MSDTNKFPRLRTVDKVKPPYPLNQFPSDFGQKLGKEIVYLLVTKTMPLRTVALVKSDDLTELAVLKPKPPFTLQKILSGKEINGAI
mgnify:CR=1 FL=1